MQIEDDAARRLGASLEALNARIARLAMALSVSLEDRAMLEALMHTPQIPHVPHERRAAKRDGHHDGATPELRQSHHREELRGLLVLRYHMETATLNDHGLTLTRQILEKAEEHLVSRGFKPGADGLALDDFFNAE